MPLPLIGVSTGRHLPAAGLPSISSASRLGEALELDVPELGLELVEAPGLDLLQQVEAGVVLLEARQQLEGRHLDHHRGLQTLLGVDRDGALGGVEGGPEEVRRRPRPGSAATARATSAARRLREAESAGDAHRRNL